MHFFKWKSFILIEMSQGFVPKVTTIDNKSEKKYLTDDKPLPGSVMTW